MIRNLCRNLQTEFTICTLPVAVLGAQMTSSNNDGSGSGFGVLGVEKYDTPNRPALSY